LIASSSRSFVTTGSSSEVTAGMSAEARRAVVSSPSAVAFDPPLADPPLDASAETAGRAPLPLADAPLVVAASPFPSAVSSFPLPSTNAAA
jgi:hypothetical protein